MGRPTLSRHFDSRVASFYRFEWQRSGYQLPVLVGIVLIATFVLMIWARWRMPFEAAEALEILVGLTLAIPIVVAFLTGKTLSVPDFSMVDGAGNSITTEGIVFAKMKVAALSTALSWLLVVIFLVASFRVWAYANVFASIRSVLWEFHGHSVLPFYATAILSLFAGMVLTWRLLVGRFWLGLVGSRKRQALTTLVFLSAPILLLVLAESVDSASPLWAYDNPDRILSFLIWSTGLAAISKFWISAFSWRHLSQKWVRQYLVFWTAGTISLVALAILWSPVVWGIFLSSDLTQVRSLMILIALMAIPLARVGFATSSLERNLHR